MSKNLLFYATVLLFFGAGIYGALHYGSRLERPAALAGASAGQEEAASQEAHSTAPAAGGFAQNLLGSLQHPLSRLLLQILVIVAAAKLLGNLFAKIRQPPVIGEMIAGILLGPSLLGMVAPNVQMFLFPKDSLGALQLLSQVGVILFMFVVGIELDLNHLRHKAEAAVLVSHASILVPFFLGILGAMFVYRSLAPAGVPFNAFALFLGVALSITAFPVLARILEDRRMSKSNLGTTAIACAAVDDVTAWCLLAVVIALAKADGLGGALLTILLTLAFIAFMLFGVRPRADRMVGDGGDQTRGPGLLAVILLFVFASALFTEVIGIHALFGAFLAGVCMPQDSGLRKFLRERLETFSSVLLLPLFFAFTGLRTQIGLLNDWKSWMVCAGVIAVAIVGKLGGSMMAARWTGMDWRESFSLGALMNTRGLVELIVLNLGYDLGILSPQIFAMMVLMALITTFMTGPLLNLVEALRGKETLLVPEGSSLT